MRAAWRRIWRTLGRGCVGLACALALPAGAAQQALLVGVSEYPALPERRLAGPANDVRLMVRSLSSLGWQPGQMQVLAEQGDAMPSRANILQALARLAQSSRSGDWVLLYFSGHGAQVPSKTGLDEVFLPRDTAFWDAQRQEVKGALRDKELAAALQRIRAQGANVWAVFDTCHAADMLRGRASGRARFISAPELRIPVQLWTSAQSAPVPVLRQMRHHAGTRQGEYIGFFAASKDEGSLEESLPDPFDGDKRERYGLFTWALAQALRESAPSDFAALARRIAAVYAERPFPTPEFIGRLEQRGPW